MQLAIAPYGCTSVLPIPRSRQDLQDVGVDRVDVDVDELKSLLLEYLEPLGQSLRDVIGHVHNSTDADAKVSS